MPINPTWVVPCTIRLEIRHTAAFFAETSLFYNWIWGIPKTCGLFRKRHAARLPEVVNLYYDQWWISPHVCGPRWRRAGCDTGTRRKALYRRQLAPRRGRRPDSCREPRHRGDYRPYRGGNASRNRRRSRGRTQGFQDLVAPAAG